MTRRWDDLNKGWRDEAGAFVAAEKLGAPPPVRRPLAPKQVFKLRCLLGHVYGEWSQWRLRHLRADNGLHVGEAYCRYRVCGRCSKIDLERLR